MAKQIGFKPEALERIARSMGHNGNMSKFPAFLASDPSKQHLMERYKKYAGGMVLKAANGGGIYNLDTSTATPEEVQKAIADFNIANPTVAGTSFNTSPAMIEAAQTARPFVNMETVAKQEQKQNVLPPTVDLTKQQSYDTIATLDKDGDGSITLAERGATAYDPVTKTYTLGETTPTTDTNVTPTVPTVKQQPVTTSTNTTSTPIEEAMAANTSGNLPPAAVTTAENIPFDASTQNIAAGTGQVNTTAPAATQQVATPAAPVATPVQTTAAKIDDVERVKEGTEAALGKLTTEQLDPDDPRLQVDAAQQTKSSVSGLDAAQGQATLIGDEAPTRTVGTDERVSGTTVDTSRVGQAFGTGEVQAASVVDELGSLMADFEGGNTPVWAKGAMRAAREDMARRGLGGSSMSSQAIIQAAMQAALPIAQLEAGNKQQIALFKGEQRAKFMQMEFDQAFQTKVINAAKVENAANMQFSADQQIVLENSRLVNTMNLQNLSNKQSMVLAEASALANLDMANLNNRQQAEVINAQNFLQVDMANMSNRQQVEMFKSQQRIGALFSDQAAGNAAQQFNASSENQMEQFFKNLQTQVQQFNSSQTNAMEQFNAGQGNAISQFNTQIENQRDQFNAQNQLVIAQSNAQWRRQIATADTAAVNRANEINAQNALAVSQQAYANLWQERADKLKQAWQTAENAAQMEMQLALQESKNSTDIEIATVNATGESVSLIGAALAAAS